MRGYNDGQKEVLSATGNVAVSASAGSGKTTVMIEKIYRLISEGYSVSRMAVMTFSRASAAEMKNRLVKKLYEAVRQGGEEGNLALKQLEEFPFAGISTIDGFCYSLIKKYYAVIGADPSATPLDPDESDAMWNECVERACEYALSDSNFVGFAEKYSASRRFDNVKKLINSLKFFLSVQPDCDVFLTEDFTERRLKFLTDEFRMRLSVITEYVDAAAVELKAAEMDKEYGAIFAVKEFIASIENKEGEELLKSFGFAPVLAACARRKEVFQAGKEAYKKVKDVFGELVKDADKFYRLYWEKSDEKNELQALFDVTDAALKLYEEKKTRAGKLDFTDLNRLALKILGDEVTAEEVRNSYDYIFVDEYQDTNLLQEELLKKISGKDNVFVVGDVKQAIYKFRYAEPEIFNERMRIYSTLGEGRTINLNENYRSKKDILNFVNDVCSEVMTEPFCGINYRRNPMIAGADYAEESSGVEIYLYKEAKEKEEAVGVYSVREALTEDKRDREGEFIAKKISEFVGKEKIYRPKKEGFETVSYGDIAVLTRKGADGLKIAAALAKQHIPYTVDDEDEEVFFPRELLVDFLRLCIGEEDVYVINAASSPMFALSAGELCEIAPKDKKTSFWEALNTYNGNETIKNKIGAFLTYAENLREISSYLTASEIMIKILSDGLDGYFDKLGEEVGGRIRKFVDFIKGLECDKNVSDFITYYDESYKGEKPPVIPDSVVIMTMHKSKGLEFPIVFLPYCDNGSAENMTLRDIFFADRDLGVAIKSVGENSESRDTFATETLKLKKLTDGRKELARLMYVDFTRAENKLIITGKRLDAAPYLYKANSILGFIECAAEKNPRIKFRYRELPAVEDIGEYKIPTESAEPDFSYLTEKYPYEKSTVLPNKRSVSEILEETDGETYEPAVRFSKKDRGDALLGTAYHLFMQKADLSENTAEQIEKEIKFLVESGEIEAETAEKMSVAKIAALLQTDLIKTAARNKIYREIPFISKLTGEDGYTLVQGVADLIIEEADGLTVVDFKASGLKKEFLTERYAEQVRFYADAAERILGRKVKRKVLLNILLGYEADVD